MGGLTVKEIEGRILSMVHHKLEGPAIRALLETQYRELANTWGWSFAKLDGEFNTFAELSGGTITLTNAAKTIAGASTAFTSDYDDGYLRVDSDFYRVNLFTNTTTGTLKYNYGGTTGASKTYTLNQARYELDPAVWYLISISGGGRDLIEVTHEDLADLDESRQSSGDPLYYSYSGFGSGGGRIIELWPVPNTQDHFNYVGMKMLSFALTSNSTTLEEMIVTVLIKSTAAQAAMSIALAEKDPQDAQKWFSVADKWEQQSIATLQELQMRDINAFGAPHAQRNSERGNEVSDDFASRHDLLLDL